MVYRFLLFQTKLIWSEAATIGALQKQVFLKISQYSQENTSVRVSHTSLRTPFFTEHFWTTGSFWCYPGASQGVNLIVRNIS